jgi:protocatechuate 3,4-dioxygenase, alpha subunit
LNQQDEVLNSIENNRKHTLIAQKNGSIYAFNIKMQGEDETVFFEL